MQRNSKDSLGDRIKTNYEGPACHYLTRRLPVIVRLDGRAFHTFTANMVKPFDQHLIDAMIVAAYHVFGEMQGCKLAYIQSDEASFVMTDFDTLETEPWFGYRQSKVESVSASLMTAAFARAMRLAGVRELATFDARAFNIPEDEVANYFVWRAKDWRETVSRCTPRPTFRTPIFRARSARICTTCCMIWARIGPSICPMPSGTALSSTTATD